MDDLLVLRKLLLGKTQTVDQPHIHPDLYAFMGSTKEERVRTLQRIVYHDKTTDIRNRIATYIIEFWERSTISIDYKAPGYKGLNLAKRPFLTPSTVTHGDTFGFGEQYRWDTFFQNRGLLLVGGHTLALGQILNLTDTYKDFKRIPNALSSPFFSRPQPPFEMMMVMDVLNTGYKHTDKIRDCVTQIEQELVTEWLDYGTGKQNHRQSQEMVTTYGLLTRYEPHSNPFIVGCEDGKDHNWTTAKYSYEHLPVQLNAIIYGILLMLEQYYASSVWGNNTEKVSLYKSLRERMYSDFQKTFWCTEGKWRGFRNVSLIKGTEGHILYGDLSTEIFPLFFKLATPEQAAITNENIKTYYNGSYGLASTSQMLREGGSIQTEPAGGWKFQWEYPNCWPPLMMIAVEGLKHYGYMQEARTYEENWIHYVESEFDKTGGFSEKYPFDSSVSIEPGYYGTMRGFGWTIATYLCFMKDLSEA